MRRGHMWLTIVASTIVFVGKLFSILVLSLLVVGLL